MSQPNTAEVTESRTKTASMEEAVASQTQSQTTPTQLPNPPSTAQCPPPQPLSLPLPPKSKKRPLDPTTNTTTHSQNSNYFKMRAVLKQLRPHFLEVNFFIPICSKQQLYSEFLLVLEILCDIISGFLFWCMHVYVSFILALIGSFDTRFACYIEDF